MSFDNSGGSGKRFCAAWAIEPKWCIGTMRRSDQMGGLRVGVGGRGIALPAVPTGGGEAFRLLNQATKALMAWVPSHAPRALRALCRADGTAGSDDGAGTGSGVGGENGGTGTGAGGGYAGAGRG